MAPKSHGVIAVGGDTAGAFAAATAVGEDLSTLLERKSREDRSGTSSMEFALKLETLIDTFGHWDPLYELYRAQKRATTLKQHYEPTRARRSRSRWRSERERVLEEVSEIGSAESRY